MTMTEPQQILVNEAKAVLWEAGSALRKRGWPVELLVDYVAERDNFTVSLRFTLPPIPVPIEAGRG